jgi:hypothetical protein
VLVRVLICDSELDLRQMIERIATRQGHEVVGVADSLPSAEMLIGGARPEVVVLDPAIGFGTDYDLVEEASAVGARVVVFSHTANEYSLDRYDPRPIVVPKPSLDLLEEVLRTITPVPPARSVDERRRHPARTAGGRRPVSPEDNDAFYEAISTAETGDVLIWIDFASVKQQIDPHVVHRMISGAARSGDRLVLSPTSIRGYLPGAGDRGIASFWARLDERDLLLPGVTVQAVVVGEDEHPNDAFDRLRRTIGS